MKQQKTASKNLIIKKTCGSNNEGIPRDIRMYHQPG